MLSFNQYSFESQEAYKNHFQRPRNFGKDLVNQQISQINQQHKLCRENSMMEIRQQCYMNDNKENVYPNKYQLQKSPKLQKQLLHQESIVLNEKIEIIPTNVVEYVKEIFDYLRSTESKFACNFGYMTNQKDINPTMRSILFDWLVDVQIKFKLLNETLYLTFNIIDRYLEKANVTRKNLQLVGVTALFIACKYEEIYPPSFRCYLQITENAYTKQELLEMEAKIIIALEFNFTIASSYRFFERYEQVANLRPKESALCKYLIELCQIEYKMLKYSASMIACSSIYLTNKLFKKQISWEKVMEDNSKYTENELKQCAKEMCFLLDNSGKGNLTAVKRKFASKNFEQISQIQIERVK